ncbi:MAG: hypothetical protein U1D55_05090 [Phycisphaerae bacterium]
MKMSKFLKLAALVLGGATVFQSGCINQFWQGFFNTGWPTNNPAVNLGLDILNEELFG